MGGYILGGLSVAGGVLGAVGTLGMSAPVSGAMIAGGLGMIGSSMQNSAQQAMVNQQEAYSTSMANTGYQRTVADLQAAGLNPLMMYQGGGGLDNAPTGSTAQMINILQPASSAAQSAGSQMQSQPVIDQQVSNARETGNILQTQSDIANQDYNVALTKAQIAQSTQDAVIQQMIDNAAITANSAKASDAQTEAAIAQAQYQSREAQINYNMAYPDAFLERGENAIGAVTGARQAYRLFNGDGGSFTSTRNGMIYNTQTGELAPSQQ